MATHPMSPAVTPVGIKLPIVLPQFLKDIRGSTYSPFVRAYVPDLQCFAIDRDTFLAFIDGLNEAYVAHPALDAVNIASSVISMGVPEPTMQMLFGSLAMGSLAANKASSASRSKAYLKAVNASLFHPIGLHADIMATEDMMQKVGCRDMKLPLLDTLGDSDNTAPAVSTTNHSAINTVPSPEDPRMRRMKALEGFVMPLDFDVPPVVSPDNLLKRMSNASAKRMTRKQQAKLSKKQQRTTQKYEKTKIEEGAKEAANQQELARLQQNLHREQAKLDAGMISLAAKDAKERSRMTQAYEKETAKIAKEMDKKRDQMLKDAKKSRENGNEQICKDQQEQEKAARKIRWVVIANLNRYEDGDDLSQVTTNSSDF